MIHRFFRRENGRSGDIFVAASEKQRGKDDGVKSVERVAGHACGMASRWRREDYDAVKHDKCFSDWKILVSPSDWKEQPSSVREGTGERFRSRNLPSPHVGSGVYELGVTLPVWKAVDQSDSRSLKSEDVIVVYVGHADHIRKRLQRYGQAGAHLEGPRSPKSPMSRKDHTMKFPEASFAHFEDMQTSNGEEHLNRYSSQSSASSSEYDRYTRVGGKRSSRLEKQLSIPEHRVSLPAFVPSELRGRQSPRGPRLFSEVFAMGCSIAYRWASTRSKEVAEYVVSDLTEAFDYAWNRGANSHARSQDILAKVVSNKRGSYTSCCSRSSSRWIGFPFMRKVVGIKIAAFRPAEGKARRLSGHREGRGLFMLLKKSPHLMIIGGKSAKHREFTKINIPVDRCGVLLENGLVCNALPQKGRKRCLLHFDVKRPSRRKSSQVASQDSRSGSLASISDSQKSLSLPRAPSSCFPIRIPKKPKQQEAKRRGSVSFSTWLSRSEILKAKSVEWLLAMEEIKGRGNNNPYNDISTSPILKPVILSPDMINPIESEPPVRISRISLNISRGGMETVREQPSDPDDENSSENYVPKVDDGMPYSIVSRRSPVRWPPAPLRDTYATSYNPPQFPRISFS